MRDLPDVLISGLPRASLIEMGISKARNPCKIIESERGGITVEGSAGLTGLDVGWSE